MQLTCNADLIKVLVDSEIFRHLSWHQITQADGGQ